jgi:flagellar hook-length control protein FliK
MLALRQITVPPSGAAGKSLATSGVDHDTAEDANDSTDRRSSSRERDLSAEAGGSDSGAVEMPVPPASEPPPPSGMRLATTPFDMTNHQQLNEELSAAGPRDGVFAPGASATGASERSAQLSEIVARFDEHFLSMVKSGGNTFKLSLQPANLGFLTINCRESSNQLTIEVVTESAVTQEFLATRADELRDIAARCGFESPRVDIHAEADSLMQRERERRYTPSGQSREASGRGLAGQRSAGLGDDDSIRIPTLAAGVLAVA